MQEEHVIHQALGVGTKPEAKRRRHGNLQVGVARHEHTFVALALLNQCLEELLHSLGDGLNLGPGEELQVNEDLVVARTSAMDLLAHIAQPAGQHQLHLRVYILHTLLNDKLSALSLRIDILQLSQELLQFIGCEQTNGLQHRDMGHRAQYIVFGQVEVHLPVTSYGKAFDILVDLYRFFPKFSCHG